MDTTCDGLLNNRLAVEQPKKGYRIAMDTVLLAAAVPARAGQAVFEAGCGVGGAMLCLTCRVPGVMATGLEVQAELAELCSRNIERNGFQGRLGVDTGAVETYVPKGGMLFDHVMMNPPYHDAETHTASPSDIKRVANSAADGALEIWLSKARAWLKPDGVLTMIHKAEYQDRLTGSLQPGFRRIEILPLLPKQGRPARRILVRAGKSGAESIVICRSLILHKDDGAYTPEADAALRDGKELAFEPTKTE